MNLALNFSRDSERVMVSRLSCVQNYGTHAHDSVLGYKAVGRAICLVPVLSKIARGSGSSVKSRSIAGPPVKSDLSNRACQNRGDPRAPTIPPCKLCDCERLCV